MKPGCSILSANIPSVNWTDGSKHRPKPYYYQLMAKQKPPVREERPETRVAEDKHCWLKSFIKDI